jgi:hypothetical protein
MINNALFESVLKQYSSDVRKIFTRTKGTELKIKNFFNTDLIGNRGLRTRN